MTKKSHTQKAPLARSNEDLARRLVDVCRRTRTILPATTTIKRLCADALVDSERRIEARIAERLLDRLDHLQRLDFPEGLFDDSRPGARSRSLRSPQAARGSVADGHEGR